MSISTEEAKSRLSQLDDWTLDGDYIAKEFEFNDFVAAFDFMKRVAPECEALGHHPEWSNVYNKVNVRLSTHDAGGLTNKDFELAAKMDQLAQS